MAATYITRVFVITYLLVVLKDLGVRKVAVVSSNPKSNRLARSRLCWGHRAAESEHKIRVGLSANFDHTPV